jgi:hypothetical protein
MRLLVARDFAEQMRYAADVPTGKLVSQLQEKYRNRPEGVAAAAVAAWGEDALVALGAGDIAGTFTELTNRIASLPEFVLYAPVRLSPASLERIGSWCRQHVDGKLLIDARINPEVVGGCAYVWKDHYYDFSLRYFMNKHQHEISALMDHVQAK